MNEMKNARSVGATTERAERTAAFSGAAASYASDSTPIASRCQVASALPTGAQNAVDGTTLAAALGFRNRRELSKQIERERRSGQPICAVVAGESRGYYLAADSDELSRYIRSLDRRIREVRRTREACGETLRLMTEQETMEGWNG